MLIPQPAFADSPASDSAPSIPAAAASAPLDAQTPGGTAKTAAVAEAQTTPFPDLPQNHWAYQAIEQLKADGYLTGYADGLFKGNRPVTRWEMAVLTERVVQGIQAKMPQLLPKDVDAIRTLVAAFQPEIDQLKKQVAALEGRVAVEDKKIDAVQKQTNANARAIRSGRIGFNLTYRPGSAYTNLQVQNNGTLPVSFNGRPVGPGGMLPTVGSNAGNAPVTFNTGIPDTIAVGPFGHGTNFDFFRLLINGDLNDRFSYGARLKTQTNNENALGSSALSPSLCPNTTTTNCSFSDLANGQNTLPINLDYAYLQYKSRGGITAQLGRYVVYGTDYNSVAPNQFLFGGQALSGASLAYNQPNHRVSLAAYYGIPSVSAYNEAGALGTPQSICSNNILGYNLGASTPALSGVNPNCNGTGQEFAESFTYYEPKFGTSIGINADAQMQRSFTYYDPLYVNSCAIGATSLVAVSPAACTANGGKVGPTNSAFGNYLAGLGNFSFGEVALSQEFGPRKKPIFRVDASTVHRFGTNPFTGSTWADNNGYAAGFTFASKGNLYGYSPNPVTPARGLQGSNVVQLSYQEYGINSTGGSSGITQGSSALTGLGITNFNGMQLYAATYQHWLLDSLRFGVYAANVRETNGVLLPVGTIGGANTCRGCVVRSLGINTIYLDAWLYYF